MSYYADWKYKETFASLNGWKMKVSVVETPDGNFVYEAAITKNITCSVRNLASVEAGKKWCESMVLFVLNHLKGEPDD